MNKPKINLKNLKTTNNISFKESLPNNTEIVMIDELDEDEALDKMIEEDQKQRYG